MREFKYKCNVAWHDRDHSEGALTDCLETADRSTAETYYRALLAREDLVGKQCVARLVAPQARRAIYYSRFSRQIGDGRIHPDAPLDLCRLDDGTAEATAWVPPPPSQIDWVNDTRQFREVLAEWVEANNGGARMGKRTAAAAALGVQPNTLACWLKGRGCGLEPTVRRLMAALAEKWTH